MSNALPQCVFVYGTLKCGEVRARRWPRTPVSVEAAEVAGALFDLGSYPALVVGEGRAAGELWRFAEGDVAATLAGLDQIEGYRGTADDLYRREVITCQTASGTQAAWTYVYARPQDLSEGSRMLPGADGLCRWSNPLAPVDD